MTGFWASWKTTSTGIAACIGAVITVWWAAKNGTLTPEIITTAVSAFLVGIGLIFARDNGVSSEQAGAKPPAS